jgi:hypothetical protein
MTKEAEMLAFLDERVFNPVLSSSTASVSIKNGVRITRSRMEKRDAVGMLSYFWSAVQGTDRSIRFADMMKAEGFDRFEEILEDFRRKFDDAWVRR